MDADPRESLRTPAVEIPRVRFALIPAGAFLMGDARGRPDEQPVHRVHVSAFEMAVLPVTNTDYAHFLAATGHESPPFGHHASFNAPGQPVVGVSWFDAVSYCKWLSAATGATWRLPTEAEREKAMRGGSEGRRFPWGDDAGLDGGRFTQEAPRPAGMSEPNGYGLLDIAYNVHEWCSDWYGPEYYAASPELDPRGPASGTRRSSRGGAWRHQIKVCRCAARSSLDPTFRYNDYGFRVVRELGSHN
ncbi:MAG: SUMF1/EgtB/PvdO family nonheme iron enzyme [Dehalococcoidia bacterium]